MSGCAHLSGLGSVHIAFSLQLEAGRGGADLTRPRSNRRPTGVIETGAIRSVFLPSGYVVPSDHAVSGCR